MPVIISAHMRYGTRACFSKSKGQKLVCFWCRWAFLSFLLLYSSYYSREPSLIHSLTHTVILFHVMRHLGRQKPGRQAAKCQSANENSPCRLACGDDLLARCGWVRPSPHTESRPPGL